MLDTPVRARLAPLLDRVAQGLVRLRVAPMLLTLLGLLLALAAATAAALAAWNWAVVLWLVSRIPDGLDGPVARISGRDSAFGGWADLTADQTAYGAFVVGCAIGQPDARIACIVLVFTYYLNGGSLLAYSAAAERLQADRPDERTFHFTRGLAEGTETIAAHALMALFPTHLATIAWAFAGMVVITLLQRLCLARKVLGGRGSRDDVPGADGPGCGSAGGRTAERSAAEPPPQP